MAFEHFEHEFSRDVSQDELLGWLTPAFAQQNYNLTTQSDQSYTYTRRYHPGGIIFLAVILFPIGLLFLLSEKRSAAITATLAEADGSIRVKLRGHAPPKLRRQLEELT
jgi:hypothetical protein